MPDDATIAPGPPVRLSYDPFNPSHPDQHPYDKPPARALWCWDEFGLVVVSRTDFVHQVLDHPEVYRSPDLLPRITQAKAAAHVALPDQVTEGERLITSARDLDQRVRPLLEHAFTTDRAVRRLDRSSRRAHDLLAQLAPTGAADLHIDYVRPLIAAIVNDFFGYPETDTDHVAATCQAARDLLDPHTTVVDQITAVDPLEQHQPYVDDLAARRRAEPADDLITDLVQAELAGAITRAELHYLLFVSRPAIEDTAVGLVLAAVPAMLKLHTWAKPQSPSLRRAHINHALAETHRALNPLRGLRRTTTTDTQLGDYALPAGAQVIAMVGSRVPQPNHVYTLDPTAAPGARIAIDQLMGLPDLRIADPGPHTMLPSPFCQGLAPLPVTWTPRTLSK